MFERYTEPARRIIFFARYEASQFGSPYIETEHMLLGIMREDKALTHRFLKRTSVETIRQKIERATTIREKISTSVDLPVSNECKRVLAYAAEEAERLSNKHIGSEHLMLGLLREEKSFAAQLLGEVGIELEKVRTELAQKPAAPKGPDQADALASLFRGATDLTELAKAESLNAFVGRDKEIERLIQVLGRSTKNNVVLVGERGVGKRALVEGLAQKIVKNEVPAFLAGHAIVDFDVAQLSGPHKSTAAETLLAGNTTVFFMEELMGVLASASSTNLPPPAEVLRGLLMVRKIRCICTATREEYGNALKAHGWIEESFSAIEIAPMNAEETKAVLLSAQKRLETFHSVLIDPGIIEDAVSYSNAFVQNRPLPDKALDLLDEAIAHAKAKQPQPPDAIRELHKRLRFIISRMQEAIARKEFEKARFYSDEERKERETLLGLEEQYKVSQASEVKRSDIEEVLAQWTGIPLSQIQKGPGAGGDSALDR